jgi:hypothetical protein
VTLKKKWKADIKNSSKSKMARKKFLKRSEIRIITHFENGPKRQKQVKSFLVKIHKKNKKISASKNIASNWFT